jgi:hypothetical protein
VTVERLLPLSSLQLRKERRVLISNHEVNTLKVLGDLKNIEARSVDNDNCGKIPIKQDALRNPLSEEKLPLSQIATCSRTI